ncbi:MAG: ribosome small subunit-dependent GTPase A [Bacteriovorax sp.]|nr:ribosome small subunit-dependent GTPase A [Bacteriovorax sp.]
MKSLNIPAEILINVPHEQREKIGRVVGEEINKWVVQFKETHLDLIKRKDNMNLSCGDWVILIDEDNVEQVTPYNQLARLKNESIQIIARNVDQMLIVTSLNQEFNLSRLERYVSWARSEGITPYILLSKVDLEEDSVLAEKLLELRDWFPEVGVVAFSVLQQRGLELLNSLLLPGKTSVVIGSSGVGKSTLINYIFDTKVQKTLEIGENDKGKHTTTTRKLFLTESGHYLMDNPGIRALSFDGNDSGNEVPCRYTNCTHSNEPGCILLAKLNNGQMTELQYRQKMKLLREAQRDESKNDIFLKQKQLQDFRAKSKACRFIQKSKF